MSNYSDLVAVSAADSIVLSRARWDEVLATVVGTADAGRRDGREAAHLRGAHRMSRPNPPKELDAIVDVVLRYKPKPKSDAAKKRKRRAKKRAKENGFFPDSESPDDWG